MDIDAIRKNWRTTTAGCALVIMGVLAGVFGVSIPGFTESPGEAITAGLGLILAKDAATHSTSAQVAASTAEVHTS